VQNLEPSGQQPRGPGKEDPRGSYVTGLRPGFTPLVRGSSRRITTMTAGTSRSANIRVINRRVPPRLLPGLLQKNQNGP